MSAWRICHLVCLSVCVCAFSAWVPFIEKDRRWVDNGVVLCSIHCQLRLSWFGSVVFKLLTACVCLHRNQPSTFLRMSTETFQGGPLVNTKQKSQKDITSKNLLSFVLKWIEISSLSAKYLCRPCGVDVCMNFIMQEHIYLLEHALVQFGRVGSSIPIRYIGNLTWSVSSRRCHFAFSNHIAVEDGLCYRHTTLTCTVLQITDLFKDK